MFKIKKENEAVFFKILGEYDLLEIKKINNIEDALRRDSDYRIHNISLFLCYSFVEKTDFLKLIKTSKSGMLLFIKLKPIIYEKRGITGIIDIVKKINKNQMR